MTRRRFLQAAADGCASAAPYRCLAAALGRRVKVTDVKFMIVRGTCDWNSIKIERTDSGRYGIGEAYRGWGVKDILNKKRPIVVSEDPLNTVGLVTRPA